MTVGHPTDFKGQRTMYGRQNANIKKALNVPQREGGGRRLRQREMGQAGMDGPQAGSR